MSTIAKVSKGYRQRRSDRKQIAREYRAMGVELMFDLETIRKDPSKTGDTKDLLFQRVQAELLNQLAGELTE